MNKKHINNKTMEKNMNMNAGMIKFFSDPNTKKYLGEFTGRSLNVIRPEDYPELVKEVQAWVNSLKNSGIRFDKYDCLLIAEKTFIDLFVEEVTPNKEYAEKLLGRLHIKKNCLLGVTITKIINLCPVIRAAVSKRLVVEYVLYFTRLYVSQKRELDKEVKKTSVDDNVFVY